MKNKEQLKQELQQELLEKVKEGTKPSDLKKLRGKNSQIAEQKENILDHSKPTKKTPKSFIPTPPPPPNLEPKKAHLATKKPTFFYCPACRTNKKGTPIQKRVAVDDKEFGFIKGKEYSFCSACSPKIREYNEYDLLNDNPHLWEKYPYAEADEILEKEFGIKPKEE